MTNNGGWLARARKTFTRRRRERPVRATSLQAEAQALTRGARQAAQGPRNRRRTPLLGGPGDPPRPVSAVEQPLVFEYRPGVNLIAQPRAGFDLLPFEQLRSLALLCQEIRLPVELLKREIRALEWDIVARKGIEADVTQQVRQARERLARPDGQNGLDVWVNQLIEEVLVTDAATVYPAQTRGGDLLALEIINGATIRPLLDQRGRTPQAPLPAYIQTIRGMPIGQWSREQLWYVPYNLGITSPYGVPPVEMITLAVNTALRRGVYRLSYYTAGNIPEGLVGMPSDWTVEQIESFQEYWDTLLAGDVEKLRRIKFVPTSGGARGGGSLPVHEFRQPDTNTVLDEWLLRVGCWASLLASLDPSAGRVGPHFLRLDGFHHSRNVHWQ